MFLRNAFVGFAGALTVLVSLFSNTVIDQKTENVEIKSYILQAIIQKPEGFCFNMNNEERICWDDPMIVEIPILQKVLLSLYKMTTSMVCIRERDVEPGKEKQQTKCFFYETARDLRYMLKAWQLNKAMPLNPGKRAS